jgi:NADH-quinone oxidoreductase subunit N
VANTVVSLFYYLRVIAPMAFDRAPAPRPAPLLGQWAARATGIAAVAVVAVGVAAEPLLAALRDAVLLP